MICSFLAVFGIRVETVELVSYYCNIFCFNENPNHHRHSEEWNDEESPGELEMPRNSAKWNFFSFYTFFFRWQYVSVVIFLQLKVCLIELGADD